MWPCRCTQHKRAFRSRCPGRRCQLLLSGFRQLGCVSPDTVVCFLLTRFHPRGHGTEGPCILNVAVFFKYASAHSASFWARIAGLCRCVYVCVCVDMVLVGKCFPRSHFELDVAVTVHRPRKRAPKSGAGVLRPTAFFGGKLFRLLSSG